MSWPVPKQLPYRCPRCGLTDDDECDYGGWHTDDNADHDPVFQ